MPQSVYAPVDEIDPDKDIVLVIAPMDSDAIFHDFAWGKLSVWVYLMWGCTKKSLP